MKALITGISGQDGAYLAKLLLNKNVNVTGVIRGESSPRTGLKYLNILEDVELISLDLTDKSSVESHVSEHEYDYVFNLAAQSSVANSFKNPFSTMQFNLHSTLNLVDSIKNTSPNTRMYQATSSEMYGGVSSLPIRETALLNPKSPYAISKAACHYLIKNYRESYDVHASSGILFNHESVLRRENFFIMKLIKSALDISNNKQDTIEFGNIEIKRDFGYAPAYVEAVLKMVEHDHPEDYLICSGESITLKSIVYHVFDYLNVSKDRVLIDESLFRPSEIENIYGDNSKAKKDLNWNYDRSFYDVIESIINEYEAHFYQK